MSHLQSDLVVARAGFTVDVPLAVERGEVVALLGPNGAGKSTVLHLLAGLLAPTSGSLELAGRVLSAPGTRPVPVPERRIGLMSQDPLLFPHLSAVDNVAFGPRARGTGKVAARTAAAQQLTRMGLDGLADRKPVQLSGGQRQRVALARALAADPDLLLLDEPLGALDVQTAPEIRQLLRTWLAAAGTTTVLVTHDVLDAAVLADRIVVLDRGAVVDEGSTTRVLSAPRSPFSAHIAGVNLLVGDVVGTGEGTVTIRSGAGVTVTGIAETGLAAGSAAAAVFRPSAVAVYPAEVAGSPRNHWPATVTGLEPAADGVRVRTSLGVAADLTPAAIAELGLALGARVHLAVKATEIRIHPH